MQVLYLSSSKLISISSSTEYSIFNFPGWKDNIFQTLAAAELIETISGKISPDVSHSYTIASYLFYDTYGGAIDNCIVLIPLNSSCNIAIHIVSGIADIDFYHESKCIRIASIGCDFYKQCEQAFDSYLSDIKVSMLCKTQSVSNLILPRVVINAKNIDIDSNGVISLHNDNGFWGKDMIYLVISNMSYWESVHDILYCIAKCNYLM